MDEMQFSEATRPPMTPIAATGWNRDAVVENTAWRPSATKPMRST